jgi:Rap1a immunity proteins
LTQERVTAQAAMLGLDPPRTTPGRRNRPTEETLRSFLAAVFVLGHIVPAGATFLDGDTLHDWCLSEEVGDQEACLGYVVGVADALDATQERYPAAPAELCLPEIDAKAAVDAVKQYLLVHPRTGSGAGADLVVAALSEGFPCP